MRVAILGAGAGGIGLAVRLKKAGIGDFVVFEKADGVGGTWRANTYPGAACDIQSHLYSFSFDLNPDWSETYATQPEILAYLERCTDKFGVRPHVRCSTAITEARWSDDERRWRLTDEHGHHHEAEVLVSALGMLNVPTVPAIGGIEQFEGTTFHTARWRHDHELTGERVAVVGTGASAIQVVPAIAEGVGHLTVFQRTPPYVLPRMNPAFSDEDKQRFRNPWHARRHRWEIFRNYEKATLYRLDDERVEMMQMFAASYRDRKVDDPELRARLTPEYPFGCKRVLISSDWYPAMTRPDVALVTDTISHATGRGLVTVAPDGTSTEHELDTIIWGTGFRASEYLVAVDVHGRGGRRLRDEWRDGARAHLGMTVSGFPNFFMLYGPNTNQGGNSIIFVLETQAAYIVRVLKGMRRRRVRAVEVKRSVMDQSNRELDEAFEGTVWTACDSYFRAPNGRIVTQLPHPVSWYWRRTRRPWRREFQKI